MGRGTLSQLVACSSKRPRDSQAASAADTEENNNHDHVQKNLRRFSRDVCRHDYGEHSCLWAAAGTKA